MNRKGPWRTFSSTERRLGTRQLARGCLALLGRFALSFARLKNAKVMEDAERGVGKPNAVRV